MEKIQQVPTQNPISQTSPTASTIPSQPVSRSKTSWIVILLIVLLIGSTSYFGYQSYRLNQQLNKISFSSSPTTMSPTISTTPKSTTLIANSPLFEIKDLNLTFQLPDKFTQLGNWETINIPGSTGNNICFHLVPSTSWLVRSAKAGGVGICSGKYLTINSVSSDFTAGRGSSFADISGYRQQGGEYFLGLHKLEGELPLTTNNPQEITTSNGIKYLLITGEDVDNPGEVLPSEYIGALINTRSSKYPGIVVIMKLSDQFKLEDFKQILNTFKFAE